MHSDESIEAALGQVRPIRRRHVPVEGKWPEPPFADRVVNGRPAAVICDDPGISAMVVDREDGRVLHLGPNNRPWFANSSVVHFVACMRAYQRAGGAAFLAEAGESDELLEVITDRLRAEIAGIDPPSMEDGDCIWPVMVEEFSYGM